MKQLLMRFAKGTGWMVVGGGGARFIGVISSVVIARILGREMFGAFGLIQSTIGVFQTVAGFGLGMTTTKHLAEYRRNDPARAASVLMLCYVVVTALGVGIALTVVLSSSWMADNIMAAPGLNKVLCLSALLIVFGAIGGVQQGALNGLESFRELSLVYLLGSISSFIFGVAGCIWGHLEGLILGVALSSLITVLYSGYVLRRQLHMHGVHSILADWFRERKVLLAYSFPSLLSYLLVVLVQWGSNLIIVHSQDGYAEVAILNAATQWKSAYLFLPLLVGQIAVPIMAAHGGRTSAVEVKHTLRWMGMFNIWVGGALLGILCVSSPWLMGAYGNGFRHGWMTFVVLQVSAFIQLLQAPTVKLWEASGRMWTNFLMNILWAISVLYFAKCWVALGALGIALANIEGLLVFGLGLVLSRRMRNEG
ncbi:MAG: oligosaccharide flippase family protein [bacterium]